MNMNHLIMEYHQIKLINLMKINLIMASSNKLKNEKGYKYNVNIDLKMYVNSI
jgi:hypothetical protein